MIYLFESRIPEEKSVYFALTYVYGIHKSTALLICKNLGFLKNIKIKDLSIDQINKLLKTTEFLNLLVGSSLKKKKHLILKNLISIKSYRGLRRTQGLPTRGQRTHTNARSCRKFTFLKASTKYV